jgi:predicted metal-dependent enzyme (double-stranded beta helix superfamily)
MATQRLPAFQTFIDGVRRAFAEAKGDKEAAMTKSRALLEQLVKDDSLYAHAKAWPSTEGHKNLMLYEDPDYGFVVNAVVRTAGRKGGIHDHAHAWTAYGVLDGEEDLARYSRLDDGKKDGYCELRRDSVTRGKRGVVDLVPPYAIHSENGGEARSVAVILRSHRLVGKTLQGRYKPETNETYQGEGPTQVPYEITASATAAE